MRLLCSEDAVTVEWLSGGMKSGSSLSWMKGYIASTMPGLLRMPRRAESSLGNDLIDQDKHPANRLHRRVAASGVFRRDVGSSSNKASSHGPGRLIQFPRAKMWHGALKEVIDTSHLKAVLL
jgi:hypothetical protein